MLMRTAGPKKTVAIFDLFYSTKGPGGTGIGLFVTRKIIRKHGGTIVVDSEPGKGSRFEIVLPLHGIDKRI